MPKCTHCFEWTSIAPCEHCGAPLPPEAMRTEQQIAEDVLDRIRGGPRTNMKALANTCEMSYDDLMKKLTDIAEGRDDYIGIGVDTPDYNPQDMWAWFELITGIVVDYNIRKDNVFSCAC